MSELIPKESKTENKKMYCFLNTELEAVLIVVSVILNWNSRGKKMPKVWKFLFPLVFCVNYYIYKFARIEHLKK